MVALARTYRDDVEFSPEDATRTDRDFLINVCEVAIQAGATTLNLPDTVGYCIPQDYAQMFRDVRARVPGIENIILSAHCHDDLGLAVANYDRLRRSRRPPGRMRHQRHRRARRQRLAGRDSPPSSPPASDKLPYQHNIVMNKLYPTSQMLAECITFGAAPNKAIVGKPTPSPTPPASTSTASWSTRSPTRS